MCISKDLFETINFEDGKAGQDPGSAEYDSSC